jgi:hypothetical protein
MFLAFLQANKSRIPVTWDYSGVQYLFKLVLSSNLNWKSLLPLQCMGKTKLIASFECATKNEIMNQIQAGFTKAVR